MKVFTDRMTLNRKDFELAMEQELLSVNNGLISMYIAKQYKRVLIDNIHIKALELNKVFNYSHGEIAGTYYKAVLNGKVKEERFS